MLTDIYFNTWDAFKIGWANRVEEIQKEESSKRSGAVMKSSPDVFIFRGQNDANLKLQATFDRMLQGKGYDGVAIQEKYNEFLAEVKSIGCKYGYFDVEPQYHSPGKLLTEKQLEENFKIAAHCRHSGLPTRLLDWTISPYIAAFFAFVDANENVGGNVAIWCLDFKMTLECITPHVLYIYTDPVDPNNKRQLVQRGMFTMNMSKMQGIEELFVFNGPFLNRESPYPILFRIQIPKSERSKVLKDLQYMRIDYLSLFPELDGLIRHMNENLRSIKPK